MCNIPKTTQQMYYICSTYIIIQEYRCGTFGNVLKVAQCITGTTNNCIQVIRGESYNLF